MEADNLGKPPNYEEAMATNLPGNVIPTQPATYHPPTSYPSVYNPNSNLSGPHVVTQQPQQVFVATVTPRQSKFPCFVHCQRCDKTVSTEVAMETSIYTHFFCCIICLAGGGSCCLCIIPYLTDFSKDAVHKCPQCKNHLGTCAASL